MPSVLFVCSANICRSPMAMGLFRSRVEKEDDMWQVESAGTWAIEGVPAANHTQVVLEERGLDISHHRSRAVNQALMREFDLILTMENNHKIALRAEFPEVSERIFMIAEMVGKHYDIQDPIGGDRDEYEKTARELEGIFESGLNKIKRLAHREC